MPEPATGYYAENTNLDDDLFEAALLRLPGPERAAFLDAECRTDPDLRARVEMMLEGHLNAKNFLETLPNRIAPEREIASPDTAGLEQVGSHIGPYKLLQKLGEGGCGFVYLAEQSQPVVPGGAMHMPGLAAEIEQSGFHVSKTRDFEAMSFRSVFKAKPSRKD